MQIAFQSTVRVGTLVASSAWCQAHLHCALALVGHQLLEVRDADLQHKPAITKSTSVWLDGVLVLPDAWQLFNLHCPNGWHISTRCSCRSIGHCM